MSDAGQFIAAEEAWTPEFRKKLILEAADGGPSTVKSESWALVWCDGWLTCR